MIYIKGKKRLLCISEEDINDENYLLIKNILKDDDVSMSSWIEVSLLYYKKNYFKLFLDLIKEGDKYFNTPYDDNTHFNMLLLIYNLEKIVLVKNINKEDELKIKVENLMNQIDKKKTDTNSNKMNNGQGEDYDYLSHFLIKGIYNVHIYLHLLNKYDNRGVNNKYTATSCLLPSVSSSLAFDAANTSNTYTTNIIKGKASNEYMNPLNYLIDSINIFVYLIKINNYDFVSSIYLAYALCLIYKFDICIEFSSYVLLRIIHFQNFVKSLAGIYRSAYLSAQGKDSVNENAERGVEDAAATGVVVTEASFLSPSVGTVIHCTSDEKNQSESRMDNDNSGKDNERNNRKEKMNEYMYKLVKLRNILNLIKNFKAIIKYLIGICYMKKKYFSMASYCFTSSLKIDKYYSSAYLTNTLLLLMNYLNKITQYNDFIKTEGKYDFIKYANDDILKYGYIDKSENSKQFGSNKSSSCFERKEAEKCEKHAKDMKKSEREDAILSGGGKCMVDFLRGSDHISSNSNCSSYNNKYSANSVSGTYFSVRGNKNEKADIPLKHILKKNASSSVKNNSLKKIPIKEIINLTLLYYYNYLKKVITIYSKNIDRVLNRYNNKILTINKNDIYEYDESIEIGNDENTFVKNEYYNVFLNNKLICMYLDLCEIWLMHGNSNSIILLKIIKEKINFNYVSKKFLSKYYFLIGMYYHIIKNMKRSLKYYYKSCIIYKNNASRYYYIISCIYVKKYNKAKKNLIYFYLKCKNAYVLKLYIFFFTHIANLYLNYNVLNKEEMILSLNTANVDAHRRAPGTDTREIVQPSLTVSSKFVKSNSDGNVKIVFKMLQNVLDIITNHTQIFLNDLDIKFMKCKIYELLITKYNEENIYPYFNLLDQIYQVKNFFNKKNKLPKVSYELINNYIVTLFYFNFKEKSLELMKRLKEEIFYKAKSFYNYYTCVLCSEGRKIFHPRLAHEGGEVNAESAVREGESEGGEDNRIKVDWAEGDRVKVDKTCTENHSMEKQQDDRGSKRKRNYDCISNKRRKNEILNFQKMRSNSEGSDNIKRKDQIASDEGSVRSELIRFSKSKRRRDEILRQSKKNLKYLRTILRFHRIYKIRNILTKNVASGSARNAGSTGSTGSEIYLKKTNKERFKQIINYLKKLYVTIFFNYAVMLEVVGYKHISMNIYKLYTEMYVNYDSAFVRLANIYIKNKNYSKAKKIIDNGLKYNIHSMDLFLLKLYLHVKRKHYDYSIYALEKLKKNQSYKDNVLINTYLAIIKFYKLKECKNKEERNYLINEIYNQLNTLLDKKNNFFAANLISILLSINHKYDLALESFQLLIDANEKFSFYYFSSLKNLVVHMFNHLIRHNDIINNKLFLNKLNLFFNISVKNGINDKHFYLCYANFLHILDKFDDAINLLYACYVKWPYDLVILNTLIICIDSCVSKYLSFDYVELKNILIMRNLINFSFFVIHTLLHWKHFTNTAELLSSDEQYNYYKEDDYTVEIKKKDLENLASRKYLISTYKKFEEKIKPYIDSSLPTMLKQKKMYHMKKINIQKKIYEEKKRKKMIMERKKLKNKEDLHEKLLRDVYELTYHISEQSMNIKEQKDIKENVDELKLSEINLDINKRITSENENNPSNDSEESSSLSSSSSDLFEEEKPKKRKKIVN
ncbi:tetratricopeptide repeat family protein, putative [Plasmodium malariae]|uniref:Tetratricopeptide repeat family protein, putative n=1 Tax=Plasmodium malariae TaxID=5858 RepID=A0A1A8VYH1_PLAMA|nr:tetratricopeptide repeat family protein, putative [Plasmodium malariae]SBS83900.1 conserved Plasmodium protein, unknown function [Plasmodium malariae]SBT87869.1 tetratricopeptide repeat family protein, putative [Plasmodium malariae]